MYPYDYLSHHGILGQKWGIRRFQNSDGSLTPEGQNRYRTHSIKGNIGRAVLNGSMAQRIFGVGMNRGYRQDKKEIKQKYKEEKEKITDKDKLKELKNDYKKTKGEARTAAAEALYPWQSKDVNEKIQTQNLGKQFLKGLLVGDYGSKNYDIVSTDSKTDSKDSKRLLGAGAGFISSLAASYSMGIVPIGDYAYNKVSYENRQKKLNDTKNEKSSGKKYSIDFLEAIQNKEIFDNGSDADIDKEYKKYQQNPEKYWKEERYKLKDL